MECCEKCEWRTFVEGYLQNNCRNEKCPCHIDKGEKVHYEDGCEIKVNAGNGHTFLPGCEKYNPNAGFGAVPTQPESSWETRFDAIVSKEIYSEYSKDNLGCCGGDYCDGGHTENIKEFLRTEIEASYERGRGQRENFTTMRLEAYEKGRLDVLAELEGKLPEEEDESRITENITRDTSAVLYAYLARGSNRYRTTVLTIIKSIKGE